MDGRNDEVRGVKLVGAFRANRDPKKCAVLYEKHKWWVTYLIGCWGAKGTKVEDLCQESFIRFFNSKFDEGLPAKPYLRRTARSVWIEDIKKIKVEPESLEGEPKSEGETISQNIEDGERDRRLRKAVSLLEEKYRDPVTLRYFEGLCTSEIAEILGIKNGTVRQRLFRALKQLHRLLGHGFMEPRGGAFEEQQVPTFGRSRDSLIEGN